MSWPMYTSMHDFGTFSETPILIPDNCTLLMIIIRIIIVSNPPHDDNIEQNTVLFGSVSSIFLLVYFYYALIFMRYSVRKSWLGSCPQ